jgi:hypothetical protein
MLKGPLHLYTFHYIFSSYYGLDHIKHPTSTLAHLFKTLNLIFLVFVFINYSYFSQVFFLTIILLLTFKFFFFATVNFIFDE